MNASACAATHDALTHFPNEYLLMDRLYQTVASSERSTNLFALLMQHVAADLDLQSGAESKG